MTTIRRFCHNRDCALFNVAFSLFNAVSGACRILFLGGVKFPVREEPVSNFVDKLITPKAETVKWQMMLHSHGLADVRLNATLKRAQSRSWQNRRIVLFTLFSSHDCSCTLAPRKSFDILALYKSDYYYYYHYYYY